MSRHPSAVGPLLDVLDQGRRLLDDVGEDLYRLSPAPLASSTVGEHFRHVLDAIQCMLNGLPDGAVDYDRRQRERELEVNPSFAVDRIEELGRGFERMQVSADAAIRVRADGPDEEDGASELGWTDSTVGRELIYVVNHTIHHYALIAMILRHHGFVPDERFGVAPSTLRYWKEVGRCAPLVG